MPCSKAEILKSSKFPRGGAPEWAGSCACHQRSEISSLLWHPAWRKSFTSAGTTSIWTRAVAVRTPDRFGHVCSRQSEGSILQERGRRGNPSVIRFPVILGRNCTLAAKSCPCREYLLQLRVFWTYSSFAVRSAHRHVEAPPEPQAFPSGPPARSQREDGRPPDAAPGQRTLLLVPEQGRLCS